jgi:1-acyl-sn-glycerol-3-phosphate acyltransferase
MDQYQDIRPYNDEEVRPVIEGLLANPDFIRSIAGFSFPRLFRVFPGLVCWLARRRLTAQLMGVHTVKAMQGIIALYMDKMIEKTTSRLTHSGLDALRRDRAYLFISNHRDIAMDPAFVNYMLYHANFETLQIAIGDNLLKRPFVTDLMRLNKSFIVRRSLKGRDLLKSSKQLSEYIHHCISTGRSIWIAQREGRAKDGVDRTDTALLKMLALARRDEGLMAALNALHIVPVAISYEFDPCDLLKADELYQKSEHGTYQKTDQSDIHSIVTGMVGFKGHVHVSFGTEITLSSDDADAAAALVDAQIIQNYLLQSTNHLALQALQRGSLPTGNDESARRFESRIAEADPAIRSWLLQMYANPVISLEAFASSNDVLVKNSSESQVRATPR